MPIPSYRAVAWNHTWMIATPDCHYRVIPEGNHV